MDDLDELRLPTPPPLAPRAPVYRLPINSPLFPRFATLEYPGPVHSVDQALATLGGPQRLAEALSSDPPKPIELDLQPDNPFFHTIPAHVSTTSNVVVKITKRRRKRPRVDEAGRVVEEGVFSVEPVGLEHKTVRFRAMADFQYAPKVPKDDPVVNLVTAMRSMDIPGIRNFRMPEASEDFPESAYLPPPSFSRHGLPQNFNLSAASSSVRTTTESGVVRLIDQARHKSRRLQSILFVQPEVPKGPEDVVIREVGKKPLTGVEERCKKLMKERPVWTRTALLNQLTQEEVRFINANKDIWPLLGYTFSDGPFRDLIIRFGYDPRKHPEARFYQHITLRNANNVRNKALPGTRGLIQAQSAKTNKGKEKAPTTSNLSHEFDGRNVYSKVGNFQLLDISDPLCHTLIHSPSGVLPACSADAHEGWYAFDYFDQIHQVVRRKWMGLLGGLQVSDADCEDLLGGRRSKESRAEGRRVEQNEDGGGGKGKGKKGGKEKKGGKGKGRARSGSQSGSGSGAGEGDEGEDGKDEDGSGAGSGNESGSGRDGGSDAGGSGSEMGGSSSQAKGNRATQFKLKRAPWEQPRNKRNKAKQPESEGAVLARLQRSLRRTTTMPSTPAPEGTLGPSSGA
ncbi:hypothetical protein JCM8547_009373 [Rhodosporidiobolus lusitaniae]